MSQNIQVVHALIFENDKRLDIISSFTREEREFLYNRIYGCTRPLRIPTKENPSGRYSEWAVVSYPDEKTNSFPIHFCGSNSGTTYEFPESWLSTYVDKEFEIYSVPSIHGSVLENRKFIIKFVLHP